LDPRLELHRIGHAALELRAVDRRALDRGGVKALVAARLEAAIELGRIAEGRDAKERRDPGLAVKALAVADLLWQRDRRGINGVHRARALRLSAQHPQDPAVVDQLAG